MYDWHYRTKFTVPKKSFPARFRPALRTGATSYSMSP